MKSFNEFKVELEEAISDSDKETMKKRAAMARPELEKTKDVTRKFGGEKGAKNVEQGFRSAIKRDYKKMDEEAELDEAKKHTVPKTEKEKDLAALAEPKDKITHADVMVGRGVAKEEAEQVDEWQSETPWTKTEKPETVTDKSGAKHTPYSRARDLARSALQKSRADADLKNKAKANTAALAKVSDAFSKLKEEAEQIDEEGTPTGIKIYHTTKEGKPTHGIVFTPHDARTYEKEVKSSGGKVTHRAVMYGKTEGEKHAVKEGVEIAEETLEELSKKTLGNYINRAKHDMASNAIKAGRTSGDEQQDAKRKIISRSAGMFDAVKRLTKEETEMSRMEQYLAAISGNADFSSALEEKKLTPAEMKKREEIAQAIERENPGIDMGKKMAIATAQAKKVAEEVVEEEQIDEISKMTSGEYLVKAGKQIDAGIADKAKREKRIDGYFNASARLADMKPTSWRHKSVKEEIESMEEAMISYNDFMDKIAMHRKMGNKVVDDKYSDKHATYTSIDKEGVGRKVTHTASGQKMENLGKINGDDDEAAEVKTEKRGRGRPAGTKSGARRHS